MEEVPDNEELLIAADGKETVNSCEVVSKFRFGFREW